LEKKQEQDLLREIGTSLRRARQEALPELLSRDFPSEKGDEWIAYIWLMSFFAVFNRDGYRLTLTKNDKELL
jgi:hypothetical protein